MDTKTTTTAIPFGDASFYASESDAGTVSITAGGSALTDRNILSFASDDEDLTFSFRPAMGAGAASSGSIELPPTSDNGRRSQNPNIYRREEQQQQPESGKPRVGLDGDGDFDVPATSKPESSDIFRDDDDDEGSAGDDDEAGWSKSSTASLSRATSSASEDDDDDDDVTRMLAECDRAKQSCPGPGAGCPEQRSRAGDSGESSLRKVPLSTAASGEGECCCATKHLGDESKERNHRPQLRPSDAAASLPPTVAVSVTSGESSVRSEESSTTEAPPTKSLLPPSSDDVIKLDNGINNLASQLKDIDLFSSVDIAPPSPNEHQVYADAKISPSLARKIFVVRVPKVVSMSTSTLHQFDEVSTMCGECSDVELGGGERGAIKSVALCNNDQARDGEAAVGVVTEESSSSVSFKCGRTEWIFFSVLVLLVSAIILVGVYCILRFA